QKARVFERIRALAFDPTGQRLAVSHSDPDERHAELSIVDRDTGALPLEIRVRIDSAYEILAFSADGKQLACTGGADGDPIVEVFDAKSGAEVLNFQPTATRTRSVLFLPDGRLVVANGRNVSVVKDGETQFTFSGHKGQVNALALAPDGRQLLTASHDGAIR